jgi:hypothetical protein
MSAETITVPAIRDLAYLNYGIRSNRLRKRVQRKATRFGLWQSDCGGSMYYGVRSPQLDDAMAEFIAEMKKSGEWDGRNNVIRFVKDTTFGLESAADITQGIVNQVLEDISAQETNLDAVEKAVGDSVPLKNPQTGKKSDTLTAGATRIRVAKDMAADLEKVIQRFAERAPLVAEQLRIRVKELDSWTRDVEHGFDRWATVEKARRKAKGNAKL